MVGLGMLNCRLGPLPHLPVQTCLPRSGVPLDRPLGANRYETWPQARLVLIVSHGLVLVVNNQRCCSLEAYLHLQSATMPVRFWAGVQFACVIGR